MEWVDILLDGEEGGQENDGRMGEKVGDWQMDRQVSG